MRRAIRITAATAALAVATTLTQASSGGDYDLAGGGISGGTGALSGGAYQMSGSTGRPLTGSVGGGDYALTGSLTASSDGIDDAPPCPADVNGSGAVDIDDVVAVILSWGRCPAPPQPCGADTNDDGFVNIDDVVAIILSWGPCP